MPERSVIVTRHALERARYRYGLPHLSPSEIKADVEEAIRDGREGLRTPKTIRPRRTLRGRREAARYAWTADLSRCYVLKRVRDQRNGHVPILIVVTAIQGAEPDQAAA